ncbi:hypothetical protein KYB31_15160 [Clostridium felsineum]|uniref:hypothetical protein n=1 Tax=Clostridium felsineum TaxID=36839 RepID=UPI00214D50FA|nr:hypothetical protein [Clostridium felsineum]MCR3760317.1 hypothetical protein [Clostridium felsineum]
MVSKRKEFKKLKVPYYDEKNDDKGHYEISTLEEKTVSNYTGYNFAQLDELNVFEYWLLLRDAVIYNCSQSKEGKKYLDKCWLMEQTEPDRNTLKKYFNK